MRGWNLESVAGVRWVALAALGFTSACGLFGGQSTDETDGECSAEIRETLVDDNAPSSLGFSVADLDWGLKSHALTGRWNTIRGVTTNAATGEVSLEYSLARAAGDAQVEDNNCGPSRLVVPVELTLATDDGLLDERLPARLSALRSGFAQASVSFELSNLAGAFAYTGDTPGTRLVQPEFSFALTPSGASGNFGAIVEVRSSDSVSALAGGPLLAWPADSRCGANQVPVTSEPGEPVWASLSWLEQSWSASSATASLLPLSVSFDVASARCEAETEPSTTPAVLRLSGTGFSIVLAGVFAADDRGLSFARSQHSRWEGSPEQFSERFGHFGLSLEEYDYVSLVPEISLSIDGASGSVRLIGDLDECDPVCDANGCSGCGGFTEVPLLEFLLEPAADTRVTDDIGAAQDR